MTFRNLLHRLAKDLDEKELEMEVIVFNPHTNSYHSVVSITDVTSDNVDGAENGQIVFKIGDQRQ